MKLNPKPRIVRSKIPTCHFECINFCEALDACMFLQHKTLNSGSGWAMINMPLAIHIHNLYHLQPTLKDY
jgi:hypothetical protein